MPPSGARSPTPGAAAALPEARDVTARTARTLPCLVDDEQRHRVRIAAAAHFQRRALRRLNPGYTMDCHHAMVSVLHRRAGPVMYARVSRTEGESVCIWGSEYPKRHAGPVMQQQRYHLRTQQPMSSFNTFHTPERRFRHAL